MPSLENVLKISTPLAVGMFTLVSAATGKVFDEPISSLLVVWLLWLVGTLLVVGGVASGWRFAFEGDDYSKWGRRVTGATNLLSLAVFIGLFFGATWANSRAPDQADAVPSALATYLRKLNTTPQVAADVEKAQFAVYASCRGSGAIKDAATREITQAQCRAFLTGPLTREVAEKALIATHGRP